MLAKHNHIEIPADKPFANDKLERIKIIENLTKLVQSTNQPFVISLEAPWGWGKTTFIRMWKAHLESLGHTCLYFNAWENDFVEDPLIAFIGEISKALVNKNGKGKAGIELKKLQKIGGKIVRRAIPLTIQIATQGILTQENIKKTSDIIFASSDEIANFASELAEEKIKQYEADKNGIYEFKKELAKFSKSISEGENKKSPLVFFIDELDRCRPSFTISLLERIKHIFSVEGAIFVLGIDREQIEQSTKSIYGQEMKSDGYLRRFIDFSVRLPTPSIETYCQSQYDQFHMDEAFTGNLQPYNKDFLLTFTKWATVYKLSLRTIEQCFTEMNMVLRTSSSKSLAFPEFLAFLIALKAHHPEKFVLLQSNLDYGEIQKFIEELKILVDQSDNHFKMFLPTIEAFLIMNYLSTDEISGIYESITQAAKQTDDSAHSKYLNQVTRHIERYVDAYLMRKVISNTISSINIVEGFS
ncbi:MAG: hypothetical protein JNM55_07560 [Anaerolineales bacterium]|nr:hypothetical protein [Anaerolineales bacterium]